MAFILHLETSSTCCSVAVSFSGRLIAQVARYSKNLSHEEKLPTLISSALGAARILLGDIDAVSISSGPGSYTGLRIGTSMAKGLCFSLNVPLISVNTLLVLAEGALPVNDNCYLAPMLDARSNRVYVTVLDAKLCVIKKTWLEKLSERSFSQFKPPKQLVIFGSGAAKCLDLVGDKRLKRKTFPQYPEAKNMLRIAQQKFEQNIFESLSYFEPLYL